MDLPLSTNTPTNVELLCLTADGPVMFLGAALSEADEIAVDLSGPVGTNLTGSQAIVSFPSEKDAPRITARILRANGNRLALSNPRVRPRDKRLYPRHYGNIPLRFQVHRAEDGDLFVHRWLAGSTQDLVPRPWHTPEPFMNFSVNGLSFEAANGCEKGDLLLLHLGVGDNPSRWRATGRVVRVQDISEDNAPLFQIAMTFEALPDAAMEALSDFTLAIQEALL